jgi:transposase
MAYHFLRAAHDQPFLLPPDLRDWLPEGHLAWFVLDVVDQLDLSPFYRQHRDDGHGHPAYDPKLLLGVLLYGYCLGVRSSRQVERRCVEDLAFRVLAANQTPDHVTIARFRARHEQALAGFLVASLRLCAAAGMVRVGTVALDGTKLAGNAAGKANRTLDKLQAEVAEILRQAAEADQHEDRLFGNTRGDELPPALARPARPAAPGQGAAGGRGGRAPAALCAAAGRQRRGRQGQGPATAAAQAPAARRGAQPQGDRQHHRPRQPLPAHPQRQRAGLQRPGGHTCEQVIVAAELTQDANDLQQLEPMLQATAATLAAAGIVERPDALLADSGYWSIANLTEIEGAPELLIPPAKHGRQGKPRKDGRPSESKSDGLRAAMAAKLNSEDGKARYAKRKETVEPVFGQVKDVRGARRLLRRGLAACDAEWKLLCGTHNLLKLWRHTHRQPGPRPTTA